MHIKIDWDIPTFLFLTVLHHFQNFGYPNIFKCLGDECGLNSCLSAYVIVSALRLTDFCPWYIRLKPIVADAGRYIKVITSYHSVTIYDLTNFEVVFLIAPLMLISLSCLVTTRCLLGLFGLINNTLITGIQADTIPAHLVPASSSQQRTGNAVVVCIINN